MKKRRPVACFHCYEPPLLISRIAVVFCLGLSVARFALTTALVSFFVALSSRIVSRLRTLLRILLLVVSHGFLLMVCCPTGPVSGRAPSTFYSDIPVISPKETGKRIQRKPYTNSEIQNPRLL